MKPTMELRNSKYERLQRNLLVCSLHIALLFAVGCAGIHKSQFARPIGSSQTQSAQGARKDSLKQGKEKYTTDLGLLISGELDNNLSSKHFGMVKFTFENTSQEWIRINSVNLSFGDKAKNQNIAFVSGAQSDIFFDAMKNLLEIKKKNDQAWAQAIGAMNAGINSNNSTQFKNALVTNALVSISVDQFNEERIKHVDKTAFPEGHLFNGSFIVPPGLFVYKWVLLNTKNHQELGYLQKIFLTYETSTERKESVEMDLRSGGEGFRQWMSDVKYNRAPASKIERY